MNKLKSEIKTWLWRLVVVLCVVMMFVVVVLAVGAASGGRFGNGVERWND